MNKEELEILKRALNWASQYFTGYCDLADTYVLSQEEIDQIDDEEERENAQADRDYENLLNTAFSIINKYLKEEENKNENKNF